MRNIVSILVLVLFSACGAQSGAALKVQLLIVQSIGEQGEGPGQFQFPNGLDVSPSGQLYVADTGNNRIQKFDKTGKYISHIGGFGWDSEQFQQPMDVLCKNALDVYVADQENSRIERYDKDLHWITSLYSDTSLDENLWFSLPISISMNMHGELYILDREYKRALKLNSRFEPALRFGDFDWGQGALEDPGHIHVSDNDLVFITDKDKHCINIYDAFGNYLYNMGAEQLGSPSGVCNGPNGNIYVVDEDQDQILVFDKTGRLLLQMGNSGDKLGAFSKPSDVACYQNFLYVADSGNHRIQVFKISAFE